MKNLTTAITLTLIALAFGACAHREPAPMHSQMSTSTSTRGYSK
jgi:hypothetical protein